MPSTTIDQVAKAAGVSKTTVSRVINRSPRVAADVARSVMGTIESLGYQPSARRPGPKPPGRRGMRTGNLLLLAVGYRASHTGSAINGYPQLFNGVEAATREQGLKLVVASIDLDGRLPAAMSPDEVDGVVLFGRTGSLSQSARARLEEMPAVGLMRGFDELRGKVDRVLYDNSAVGPMAFDYLAERGHKHLGYFNLSPSHPAAIVREREFVESANKAGASVVSFVSREEPMDFREEAAACRALAEQFAAASPKITGLFIAADFQAIQIYQALEAAGVHPGRDVDVISCDNNPFFLNRLSPRPASIDINLEQVGYRGVQQLLWRMQHPEVKNRLKVVIEPVIVPGSSPQGGSWGGSCGGSMGWVMGRIFAGDKSRERGIDISNQAHRAATSWRTYDERDEEKIRRRGRRRRRPDQPPLER